ncbi:MAG TPA: pilus assembly protein TadG-related protein, partial [Acidimicrobiales bacterium]
MRRRESFRHHVKDALVHGDARERGVVLAFLALVLFSLIAFAGLAIDVGNWWWTGQKVQKAADAAAMAGVTYLPDDLPSAQAMAQSVASRNGYSHGSNATVTSGIDDRPSELRVTIETEVDNFFTGIIGFKKTKIKRTAVADYAGAVPMGSPASFIGNDPELGQSDPSRLQKLWINIAGRDATKISGDRYTAGACNSSVFGCSTSNDEYLFDSAGTSNGGYRFTVTVDQVQAGRPFEIQIYDPAFIYTGDVCEKNMLSQSQANALQATYSNHQDYGTFYNDASQRYRGTGNDFCTGDQDISGADLHTAYIVREPDDTPWNDLDNPIVQSATCQPTNFRPINTSLYKYLNPADPAFDPTGVPETSDAAYVRAYFHRWVPVCTIPAGAVKTGDYILQVRTNHSPSTPEHFNPAVFYGGHNRFSIRAGFPTTSGEVPDGTGVKVFASGKLPIYVNAGTNAT